MVLTPMLRGCRVVSGPLLVVLPRDAPPVTNAPGVACGSTRWGEDGMVSHPPLLATLLAMPLGRGALLAAINTMVLLLHMGSCGAAF
jgi:hypothetical protein